MGFLGDTAGIPGTSIAGMKAAGPQGHNIGYVLPLMDFYLKIFRKIDDSFDRRDLLLPFCLEAGDKSRKARQTPHRTTPRIPVVQGSAHRQAGDLLSLRLRRSAERFTRQDFPRGMMVLAKSKAASVAGVPV